LSQPTIAFNGRMAVAQVDLDAAGALQQELETTYDDVDRQPPVAEALPA
jgi:hypothetical protein